MEKEMLWKIIRGEISLTTAMRYLGFSEQESSDILTKLTQTDKEFSFGHFSLGVYLYKLAYIKLTEIGELDDDQIFNIAKKSFDKDVEVGDIGFCGNNMYRYSTSGWEKIF